MAACGMEQEGSSRVSSLLTGDGAAGSSEHLLMSLGEARMVFLQSIL